MFSSSKLRRAAVKQHGVVSILCHRLGLIG